jgi:RNA polymerase-associated protein CTR9
LQGKLKQYLKILNYGTSEEVATHFQQTAKFERLQIFCALAAYHTAQGRSQDRSGRTDQFTRAAELLSSARQIDYEDQLPFLGLGDLDLARVRSACWDLCEMLKQDSHNFGRFVAKFCGNFCLQGDVESAKRHFEKAAEATSHGRRNVAGMLALANLHFRQGHYKLALGLYRRALREHPGAPAEVRLGLAACLFRQGQLNQAKAAYLRTLEVMPSCGEALLGLAVIAFNAQDPERWVSTAGV